MLLHGCCLFLNNFLLIFLSFNLMLDHTDLLFSFLGNSGSLRFDELGLVDLSNFFLVNILSLFLSNDRLSFFLENSLFLSLLLIDGRLFDGDLGNQL